MKFERSAGILLHPTSVPGKYGIGDLGPEMYKFIDFLKDAGQSLWQVFPLGPTGYGDSPYQCFSAFAGNPLLISPDLLIKDGYLTEDDVEDIPPHNPVAIDFGQIIELKKVWLSVAYQRFTENPDPHDAAEMKKFEKKHKEWLDDFALFMACKEYHGGALWTTWDTDIALRKPSAVTAWKKKLAERIRYQIFVQYIFHKQWHNLREYAHSQGIKIIGDLPIFIAYDSSDLWANKELFSVDETGKLLTVAGVPPDYFSPTGQLWGNPLYKWKVMEKDGFKWWKDRIRNLLEMVDILRIDHFRGFDAYWEIPGNAPTAETGKWVKAPGKKFFASVLKELGDVPIMAEDLGVITPTVEDLRDTFGFPGMKILQFAFGKGMEAKFLPHNFDKNCVVYTGSHDNDTTRGYFEAARHQHNENDIYKSVQNYLDYYGDDICVKLIRLAYASVADTVVIPMQDILNLGTGARMNFPGRPAGNWGWRFQWEQIDHRLADYYRYLSHLYERIPARKKSN
ncbi:MAG: 4-alpha-glucanotransferase [Ignavibacteriaceae bacterium]|nr:4-alpha-glucanotransferase [Ignavibacteriaceae bacterium]MCK6614837.1 4-alpha-glucanotransferase [Ignavibacteriaceae bacterium]